MTRTLIPVLACVAASPAFAAGAPDLVTTLTAPSASAVYESATYKVTVANQGTRNAVGVTLTIDLPHTHTSPTQHILGDVTSLPNRCSVVDLQVVCTLGRIKKGLSKSVRLDVAFPFAIDTLEIEATSEVVNEANPSDNSVSYVVDPDTFDVSWSAPHTVVVEHCTGQDLSSFFECELFPSSIFSHEATLHTDGTISFPHPGYSGTWWSLGPGPPCARVHARRNPKRS